MDLSRSKTEWIKFGEIKQVSFIGREVICIGSGCHMLFTNMTTGEESLYHADSKSVGEGIGTFVGHKTLFVFAFAEKCRYPRVFVMTYPGFAVICKLDKRSNEDFLALAFSESELLITLNDIPSFAVIVWNWRSAQRLAGLDTDIFGRNQLVKCNLSTPIYFAQVQTGHTKLNLWDIAVCGKKCFLTPHKIRPPSNAGVFIDILWTTEGTLFVLDVLGHVYALSAQNDLVRIIEWEENGNATASFTWYKSGLTVAGPNGIIKHFKKSGEWICDWQVTLPSSMKKITSNYKDILLGITEEGEMMHYDFSENSFKYVRQYQNDINDLCLIYPTGEYFVTLQHNREIISWELATGKMKNIKVLEEKVLVMKENPEYPYIAVTYALGVLELLSFYNPATITSLASFNLSKNPLNSIYFAEVGRIIVTANMNYGEFFIIEGLPGSKMDILATVKAQHQVCDYTLVTSEACMRLFAIYVTSDIFLAGNKLVRFSLVKGHTDVKIKEYDFETSHQMYSKLYAANKGNRDRIFYSVPLTTKCIHVISTKHEDSLAKVINVIHTGHQMKKILLHVDKHHAITYAYDGLVIIRNTEFTKRIGIVMPHYRAYGGVIKAYISPLGKYIVSLGRDNTLVGTSLVNVNVSNRRVHDMRDLLLSPKLKVMFENPTIGFSPTGELEGVTWFEMEKIYQERREQEENEKERLSILDEFRDIQAEIKSLLAENLELNEDDRIDLEEFNLDDTLIKEKSQQSQEECKKTAIYLEALIAAQDKVSQWIKDFCWNQMRVQGQVIKGIFSNLEVSNYVLLPKEDELLNQWRCAKVYRELENQLAEDDVFEPWIPKTERQLKQHLQKEPQLSEEDDIKCTMDNKKNIIDSDTNTAFKGSVAHNFVELTSGHYSQQQICSFLQSEFETLYSLVEIYKLKKAFNKTFDEVKAQKVEEMKLVIERNARLRHILSELSYFTNSTFDVTVDDPVWSQVENPESILRVEDSEVKVMPYISPTEQAARDAAAAEEERIRILLQANDFPERALMNMMNGVLEVRWENELRKEITKPGCMLKKRPDQYTQDELNEVLQYEKDVEFLNSERERYKELLKEEYAMLTKTLKDEIGTFNSQLADFLITKLEVDSALTQENLKLARIRLRNLTRIQINEREAELLQIIKSNHQETETLHSSIHSIQETLQEVRSNADSLFAKEKLIEKTFKRDFYEASQVIQEQTAKLYKRRPKINIKNVSSITLNLEVARCIIAQEKTIILTQECLDFLKALDTLDLYVNVPPAVDENTYGLVCKHRRLKTENELRIRTSGLEIVEAESTLQIFQKSLHKKKEYGQKLLLELDQVRKDRLNFMHDMEIQLVLKQGIVEVPTTGSISDFDKTILVSRKDVETINKIILRGGNRKIRTLKEIMYVRRSTKTIEWEHRRLKMKTEDLRSCIENIESIKVTKDIQLYLKNKDAKNNSDKDLSFEKEVEVLKAPYIKQIEERKVKIKELQQKIDQVIKEREALDDQITNANIEVYEYQIQRDANLEKREKSIIKMRMATLLKRSKLIKQVQKNHSDILVMQTEMELLKLRTFPTLSYTILP